MISLKCLLTEGALFRRQKTTMTGDDHQLLNIEISLPCSIWLCLWNWVVPEINPTLCCLSGKLLPQLKAAKEGIVREDKLCVLPGAAWSLHWCLIASTQKALRAIQGHQVLSVSQFLLSCQHCPSTSNLEVCSVSNCIPRKGSKGDRICP